MSQAARTRHDACDDLDGRRDGFTMGVLGFAILGLLAREPMTGYQLSRRMQAPVGYMWTASHSQIYAELAALEGNGSVRHRVTEGPGPRDTKLYTLTTMGRRSLVAWVDSPLQPQPARSELMLRVRSFWLISPQRCRTFLESVLLDHEQQLATYQAEARKFLDQELEIDDPATATFASYATVQAGIRVEEAMVDWSSWLLARLPVSSATTAESFRGVDDRG